MAGAAHNDPNIQVAISETKSFLLDIPTEYFVEGEKGLHHDSRKVNVFKGSESKSFFIDGYKHELVVTSMTEFATVKERLLKFPIYMRVSLQRHKRSGNTRYITYGDFVIMINTKHSQIQRQIQENLNKAEEILENGGRFALEFDLEPILVNWFKQRFERSGWGASYITKHTSFCVTNFARRSKLCSSIPMWILCLPCCLLIAPVYCTYRHAMSEDMDCVMEASVVFVEGTTPLQRTAIRQMVQNAFVQGVRATHQVMSNATQHQRQAPPSYDHVTPPPYQPTAPSDGDDPMLQV